MAEDGMKPSDQDAACSEDKAGENVMRNESMMLESEDDKNPRSRRSLVPMLVWSVATTTVGLIIVAAFV